MTSSGPTPPAGPTTAGPTPPASRPRRGYWIPGLIAISALLVIGLVLGAGDLDHHRPTVLYGPDVAQEIGLGIQAQEGARTPPEVHCPASEPVRAGYRFVCSTGGAGQSRQVQVTEIDGRGHLRWQLGP